MFSLSQRPEERPSFYQLCTTISDTMEGEIFPLNWINWPLLAVVMFVTTKLFRHRAQVEHKETFLIRWRQVLFWDHLLNNCTRYWHHTWSIGLHCELIARKEEQRIIFLQQFISVKQQQSKLKETFVCVVLVKDFFQSVPLAWFGNLS